MFQNVGTLSQKRLSIQALIGLCVNSRLSRVIESWTTVFYLAH